MSLPTSSSDGRHTDARKTIFVQQMYAREIHARRKAEAMQRSQREGWFSDATMQTDTYRSNVFRPHTAPSAPYQYGRMYQLSSGRDAGLTKSAIHHSRSQPQHDSQIDFPVRMTPFSGFRFESGPKTKGSHEVGRWNAQASYMPLRTIKAYGGPISAGGNTLSSDCIRKNHVGAKLYPNLARDDPSLSLVLESSEELKRRRQILQTRLAALEDVV